MTKTQRGPAWWPLYTLVPIMGGLLLLESRAALPPGGHKAVQIGIILFVYGLVWIWIWANDVVLRHDDRQIIGQDDERYVPETDDRATSWALGPDFRPSEIIDDSGVWLYTTRRCTTITSTGREIHKCSRNLDQQSCR